MAAVAGLAAGLDARQPPAENPPEREVRSAPEPPSEQLLGTLTDAAADRTLREAAAESLVRAAHRPHIADALTRMLLTEEQAEPRSLVLRAVARSWSPPSRLLDPLVQLAERTDPSRLAPVLSAIAAYPTREAAAILVSYLRNDRPAPAREAAAAALARMTGRDDLRANHAAWEQWLGASRGLSESEWRELLAEGMWRRAERLEADRRALGDRLAEGFRRLYITTPVEERSRLLSQMMLDTRPELRDVGLEIVSREIAAGRPMDSAVVDAAARLLRSADPRIRARAALLLSQLGSAAGNPAVLEALAGETDAEAAAALLQTIARSPDAAAIPFILIWLAVPETRSQAIDTMLAFHRAGLLLDESHQEPVLAVLRDMDPRSLSAAGVRLLSSLGENADRQRLCMVLESESPQMRFAAAEALAEFPEFVDAILVAVAHDPALFNAAVRSTTLWRPSVSGLMAVSELPAPSPQEHRAGLLRIAAALPMVDLLTVAASTGSDLTLREAILMRVAERPMGPFLPDQEEDLATVGECILLLAETRLALRRPDRALLALDALPTAWPASTSTRAVRARLIALLWTNRISATESIEAPASAWLDALELTIGEAHAPAVLREVRARLGDGLAPEDQRRLESLASAVPLPEPVETGQGGDATSPPQNPR